MNTKDPYVTIIKRMRTEGAANNSPAIDIGKVISDSPLTIAINDLQLSGTDLLVSDFLLPNYKRKISIPSTGASGSTTEGSISSIAIPEADATYTDGLKKGDKVACLSTLDGQTYIILCKVVGVE